MRKITLLLTMVLTTGIFSCGKTAGEGENPFFSEWDTPYNVPPFDLIQPAHFMPALDSAMMIHKAEIEAIVSEVDVPSFDNVILPLDRSGNLLTTVSRVFSLLNSADSNPELEQVQQQFTPAVTRHWDAVYMNDELYEKVRSVYEKRFDEGLDSLQIRLTEKTYDNFVRSGAGLGPVEKEELKRINEELSLAQIRFANNVLAADREYMMLVDSAGIAGLPRNVSDAAAEKATNAGHKGKYAFTFSRTSIFPFLQYADREDLRKEIYTAYLERCSGGDSTSNTTVVNDIVRLRTQRARLLGFDSHADFVLGQRMAKTPADVYTLLDGIWQPALETAGREMQDMQAMKRQQTGQGDFNSWDWWYYSEKIRKERYDLNQETLRDYFSLDNVRAGIFELSNRLFGVTFRPINIPVYNPECVTYEVLDVDNRHLGVLIMDFFPREGKRAGAWCGSYRNRNYDSGEKQDPIVTIVCNFTRPVGNRPALLSIDETETFFHEFGHALHALFTDVPYNGLNSVERDFVELPSQIMENWATEPSMLRRYAVHYSSGAVIPDNLIEKIRNASTFNQGFVVTELLAASYSDMDVHTMTHYEPFVPDNFERESLNIKRGLMEQIAPRYKFPYFSHIFSGGYSAGYYSYIWSEVLDKDAYEAFTQTGDIYNKKVAASFLENILKAGGSADGMTLYRNFRGRDPEQLPLLYARGFLERPVPEYDGPVLDEQDDQQEQYPEIPAEAETTGSEE